MLVIARAGDAWLVTRRGSPRVLGRHATLPAAQAQVRAMHSGLWGNR